MIRVSVTADMIQQAKELEARILKAHSDKGHDITKSYTGIQTEDANYYGSLGELAFKEELKRWGITGSHSPVRTSGNLSGSTDFTIPLKPGYMTIDVKTRPIFSGREIYETVLIPKKKYQTEKGSDTYVVIKVYEETPTYVDIIGYCKHNEFHDADYDWLRIPTVECRFDRMRDINGLLEWLKAMQVFDH